MINLSVCVEMFWPGLAFDRKIHNIAGLGYKAFEFWTWSDKDLAAAICMELNYYLIERARTKEILNSFSRNVEIAGELGCRLLWTSSIRSVPRR